MKTPFLLRSLFAVAVVAVFVWSMFPMTQTDFYDTFRSISKDADDPELVALIDDAKEKQKADIKEYPYPSKAIDAAANDKGGVELKKFLPENVIKNSKIKTNADVISMIRKRSAGALHLGIDLNGGAEFILELIPDPADKEKLEKDFEKYINSYFEMYPSLKDRVVFTGPIEDRKLLKQEYEKTSIFALPSSMEGGTPNVVAEALFAGCVMAVTEFDAYEDAIGNGSCGKSAPIGDVDAYSKILLELCTEEGLEAKSRKALEQAQNFYDMEKIVGGLYEQLFFEG